MFFGSDVIVSSVISKALAAYLVVDRKEIEAKLISPDGAVVLKNVQVKERKIGVAYNGKQTTFLVLSGTIQEISLIWSWTSSSLVGDSTLMLRGVRLKASFSIEKNAHVATVSSSSIEGTKKKRFSLFSHLQREFQSLNHAFKVSLKESEMIRKPLQDIMDTFSVKVADFEFRLLLGQDQQVKKNPQTHPPEIVASCKVLEFISLGKNDDDDDTPDDRMRRPLKLQLKIVSFFVNIAQGGVHPLLEPFTYCATARRVHGMRFMDMGHGYEIIGIQSETTRQAIQNDDGQGIVLHFSPKCQDALKNLKNLCSTGDDEKARIENANLEDLMTKRAPPKSSRILTGICYMIVAMLGIPAVFGLGKWLIKYADPGLSAMFGLGVWLVEYAGQVPGLAFVVGVSGFVSVLLLVVFFFCIFYWTWAKRGNIGSSSESSSESTSIQSPEPSIFRLPFTYVSVVGTQGMRITLSKLSVLGRVDGSLINVAASGFDVESTSSQMGPKVSASGIRACVKSGLALLNIDAIDDLFIPGVAQVCKPIPNTVIRFEKGTFTVKLKASEVRLLKAKVSSRSEDKNNKSQKLPLAADLDLDLGPIRRRVNAEIRREIIKLRVIAMMFETIPVQKNRQNLRLWPNTFRGNDAVDFVLDCKIAETRQTAVKILKDMQIEFNLFEHVTREHQFGDEKDYLFRFVDIPKRRSWLEGSLPFLSAAEEYDAESKSSQLPFPVVVDIRKVTVRNAEDEGIMLVIQDTELFATPGKVSQVVDCTAFIGHLQNQMIEVDNTRIHALVHPDLPKEIHRLQFSVDYLRASPEHSAEDWYDKLGFVGKEDSSQKVPYSLPFVYIAPFKLYLSWKGVLINTKESSMTVERFVGSQKTTSNDLIQHLVMVVLGRAPGILANVRILGVNVVESTGVATTMNVATKLIPFGQYAGIGALAAYDGVTGALDAGKSARNDPNDSYKPGDFIRGVLYSARAAGRAGAIRRGKSHDDVYDEDDRVVIDAVDFAVGTGEGVAVYAYGNKARFAGATVAGATMVATTVVAGPIGGIVIGVVAGAGTEWVVGKFEDRFESSKDDISSTTL